jgi:signal transduction histidine kinase
VKIVRSIRFRLALWFVLILAIILMIFSIFIYTRQAQELRASAILRLEMKERRLGGFDRYSEHGFFDQAPAQLPSDPASGAAFLQESDVLAILSSSGTVIQSWGPVKTNEFGQILNRAIGQSNLDPRSPNHYFYADLPGTATRVDYAFSAGAIAFEGRVGGFYLLGSAVDPDNQLQRLFLTLLLGSLFTLAIALVGGFWLADRAIRPVKQITRAARTIGETDLSLRLNMHQEDEIGELADTFDAMLARLEAAFERQRQFTADASHELRTPLTIVDLEATRALSAPRSNQEYGRALRVIQSENQFMIRLVNNLLTLARMDSGQVILQKQPLDLSDVVLEVVERLAPVAQKDGIRLSTGDLPELPVLGDRQFLIQMLSNLVDNAIKYSVNGSEGGHDGQRVDLGCGMRQSPSGALGWVKVIDKGPGIPPEHLERLFDRFYQVDPARTQGNQDANEKAEQASAGAGLGLSIARWVAQAHDGEIRVESVLGEGTTFEVSLPLIDSRLEN